MVNEHRIRRGWLKAMYLYTLVVAGGLGLAMLLVPSRFQSIFHMGPQDPVVFGLNGSLFLSFGLAAILGVRAPLRYCPLLLIELMYKLIWLLVVVAPLAMRGEFPGSAVIQVVIFVTFVVGNLIAIPFGYLFSRDVGLRG
jgi:hypothetical protein